jgi:hypothetical protein
MSLQERSNYTISNTSNSLITGSATIGNINTTGITTGNLNFTGNLFQNGTAYVASSQWTSTSGNISYTSGSVIIGNTSGNVALRASSSSGSYNFNLPTDSGSAGQLLVSGGGGSAPTYWGTSVAPACLSRFHSTSQTINNNTQTTVLFDTIDNSISVGVTGLSYSAGVFTNTTSTTLTFEVNFSLFISSNSSATRVVWISSSNTSNRIGASEVAPNSSGVNPVGMNSSGVVTLPANGTFQVNAFQNSGSTLSIVGVSTSPTVISITPINSGFIVPGNGGSLLARYAGSNQSIPNNTITIVAFDTLDSINSTGFTGFTYSSGTFTNSTTSPITINVNAYIAWPSSLSTSVWILTSTSSRRIGFSSATNNYQLINGTCTIPASGTFAVYAFQGSGGAVNLYQDGTSQTSIQIIPISGYSGNINATGITTSNLVVNGTTRITATTGSTAIFQNSVNYGSVLEINSTATNGRNFKIQSTASADGLNSEGAFVIDDATSSLRRFVIGSSGNVGINKMNPGYTLDVTGNINLTGTLTQNGTPFSGGGSQWTTTSGNVSYTSGKVITTDLISTGITTSNLFISGLVSSANIFATNSTVTNLRGTSSTIPNMRATNITVSNIKVGSVNVTGSIIASNFESYSGSVGLTGTGTYYITPGINNLIGKLCINVWLNGNTTGAVYGAYGDIIMPYSNLHQLRPNISNIVEYNHVSTTLDGTLGPFGGANSTATVTDNPVDSFRFVATTLTGGAGATLYWTIIKFSDCIY